MMSRHPKPSSMRWIKAFIGRAAATSYVLAAVLACACGVASQMLQIIFGLLVDSIGSGSSVFSGDQWRLLALPVGVSAARLLTSLAGSQICLRAASNISNHIRMAYVTALYASPDAVAAVASAAEQAKGEDAPEGAQAEGQAEEGGEASSDSSLDGAGILAADMLLIDEALGPTWVRTWTGVATALSGIVLMAWTHWPLGLVACSVVAISVTPAALLQRTAANAAAAISPAAAAAFSRACETMALSRTIFAFRGEALASARYAESTERVRTASVRSATISAMIGSLDPLGYALVYAVLFYCGALFQSIGTSGSAPVGFPSSVSGGQVLAVIALAFETVQAIQGLMEGSVKPYMVAATAARRLARIMSFDMIHREIAGGSKADAHVDVHVVADDKPAVQLESTPSSGAKPLGHTIQFEDVHFAYPSAPDKPILSGVSFTLPPGAYAAITGPSGCGKSTVVQLLLGFYKPQKGRILIDGVDIATLPLTTLRASLGYIPQAVSILPGLDTIEQQIAVGILTEGSAMVSTGGGQADMHPLVRSLHAVDAAMGGQLQDAVRQAARDASADGFISKLPAGYASMIAGSEGSAKEAAQLSGGQRQRLGIARALMRSPWLLLADEPTAALDGESEEAVQAALEALVQARQPSLTLFMVTHKLQSLKNASHILVLEGGRLVQQGTHDSLLAQKQGLYSTLLTQQLLKNMAIESVKKRAGKKISFMLRLAAMAGKRAPADEPASVQVPVTIGAGSGQPQPGTALVDQPGGESAKTGQPSPKAVPATVDVAVAAPEKHLVAQATALDLGKEQAQDEAPDDDDDEESAKRLPAVPLRELLLRLTPYKLPLACMMFFSVTCGAVWPVAGLYITDATNAMYEVDVDAMLSGVTHAIGPLVACMVAQGLSEAVSITMQGLVAAGLTARLRNEALAHVMDQGPAWFDAPGRAPASCAARISTYSDGLGKSFAPAAGHTVYTLCYTITALALAVTASPIVFGACCAVGSLYVIPPLLDWRVSAPLRSASTEAMSGLTSTVTAILSPSVMRSIQALGIDGHVLRNLQGELRAPLAAERYAMLAEAASENAMGSIEILAWCLCMWAAGQLMLLDLVDSRTVLPAVYMSMYFVDALKLLAQRAREFITVDMNARKLFQWLPQRAGATAAATTGKVAVTPVGSEDGTKSLTKPTAGPLIQFGNVTFCYPSAPAVTILNRLNLTILPGQVVCLCGPSGSGKSTVFSLLQGIYAPTSGSVLFQGVDVRDTPSGVHRARFNWVPQDAPLFDASVLFNTAYAELAAREADPEAFGLQRKGRRSSLVMLLEAAQARMRSTRKIHPSPPAAEASGPQQQQEEDRSSAEILAEASVEADKEPVPDVQLSSMRNGSMESRALACLAAAAASGIAGNTAALARQVGSRGSALSGGERQRLAIARAFYRDAPVMLLDEDSSALDARSEKLVQASMDAMRRQTPPAQRPAMLFIAHRLSRAKKADIIYVLAEGCVVESGTWASLLARDTLFRRMAQLQDPALAATPLKQ